MARIFQTGFETGHQGVFDLETAAVIQTDNTRGPWSTYSIRSGSGDRRASLASATEVFLGMGCNLVATEANTIVAFNDGNGTRQVTVRWNAAAVKYEVYRGTPTANLLGTASQTTPTGSWHYLEWRVVIHGSAGVVTLRVDGVTLLNLTNVNTQAGTANVQQFVLSGSASNSHRFDDIVVNDTTGAKNNSWPGEQKIQGIVPNATGDSNQLTPIGGTSVSRFYFPAVASFPSPLTTLQPDSQWEVGTSAPPRGVLAAGVARGTTMTTYQTTSAGVANNDVLVAQYVSKPLSAQTISGTVKMQARASESAATLDARSQLVLRVVSGDGSTVRGVLYAGNTGALTSEWATSLTNRKFPPDTPITLSSVAAQDGDRLVVEIGYRHHANITAIGSVRLGDSGASDLPEDETTTTDLNPWIEFSNAVSTAPTFNYDEVDEVPPDDDQTYVYGTTAGLRDLYNLSAISQFDAVDAITVWGRAKKSDAGAGGIKLPVKSSGTVSAGSELVLGAGSYRYVSRILEDDPAGGGWTPSAINALQAGVDTT